MGKRHVKKIGDVAIVERIANAAAFSSGSDQTQTAQETQLMGNRRRRMLEASSQLADRQFLRTQQCENRQSTRIAHAFEQLGNAGEKFPFGQIICMNI